MFVYLCSVSNRDLYVIDWLSFAQNEEVRHSALTFPSDNPTKRIDFVLFQSSGDEKSACTSAALCMRQAADHIKSDQDVQAGSSRLPPFCDRDEEGRGGEEGSWSICPTSAYLIGQDFAPGSDDRLEEGVGMVDERSPLWPSDHRGLVVDFTVSPIT